MHTLASQDDHDGGRSLLETLARLWVDGVAVDAGALAGEGPVASVPPTVLPRESYWAIKDKPQAALEIAVPTREVAPASAPIAGRGKEIARLRG